MIDTSTTNKYGHTHFEMGLMVLITTISNLVMIPSIIYTYKVQNNHTLFVCVLLITSSFMYHLCDSTGIEPIILNELEWHQLDNIASICAFIELFNYLMRNDKSTRKSVSWIAFISVVIVQESHAWDLWATILPILLIGIILVVKILSNPQKYKSYNKNYLFKGLCYMTLAIIAFSQGLNEFEDYLRIWHGLWHISFYFAYYHLYQLYNPKQYTYLQGWNLKQQYAFE